jgi:anti-sigma regulatory factor (Ser/Thr protein kinase)
LKETRLFHCRPEAVTAVRGFVRGALDAQSPRLIEAAELMASELATNCVRHAQTDFELTVEINGEIRVEVRDVNRGRPTVRSPALAEPSGRGLRIVQALSDAWGVTPSPEGKVVWFALYVPDESSFGATASTARRRSGSSRRARQRAVRPLAFGGADASVPPERGRRMCARRTSTLSA